VDRFLATLEDAGVRGFHAERRNVRRHVGTRLVDDRNDAERNSYLRDVEAALGSPRGDRVCERVWEERHRLETRGHRLDSRRRERQPIDERCAHSRRSCDGDVHGVRTLDLLRDRSQPISSREESL